ncbi:MAG: acetyl-CoA carboxylase biotin carboxylase subunit, partial [Chloroflexota bacterium]
MFKKVLVANRGEIALRIIRTLEEMGIASVAVYSDADRDALFVREADEAFRLGPAPAGESYLNIDAILAAAVQSGAEAIHPGYGFLSENAGFAQAVEDAGLVFIGPSAEAIGLMGDKLRARQLAVEMGVPVVPGTTGPVHDVDEALAFAAEAGYPVAVKASGGGGGRGIRIVKRAEDMAAALESAGREAESYFRNSEVYLERYYPNPRHVEIQVLGDRLGHLVHLGERDCSVQRRHQKLIEETPGPAVNRELRERMGAMALRIARRVDYNSAGTVEFLLTREGEFYFLEMNTRIQVEHPITELVTGTDLIREMILAAAGEPISVTENTLDLHGHAIELRINAENPSAGFRPTPAMIASHYPPAGPGVRMDTGVEAGYTIPQEYDSLISKLIVWAPEREQARRRAIRALNEYRIEGPSSTAPFARAILEHPTFQAGEAGTTFVEEHLDELVAELPPETRAPARTEQTIEPRTFHVEVNGKRFHVRLSEEAVAKSAGQRRAPRQAGTTTVHENELRSPMHG